MITLIKKMIINGLLTLYSLAVWNNAKVKTNKKWKILFTIPNFDTVGSGKALLNLCNRLDKRFSYHTLLFTFKRIFI